ncbi:helix-turn-helix domain-containing protein [Parafrankia sp. BMG5.11]|uniref:helix-turn-helix domain-containing protein n=1 Tax=Parafrankia sp. BMG5.11 TaxID=222540 RepID=UPI001FB3AB16|nr:helix-turn-helix domain-containing protein [Parafrankia sp. BMG5.11]
MDDAELRDQVSRLRGEGKSPKQIARALGVAPSRVAPLVRAAAAQARATAGLPPVVGCWVNVGWSRGLAVNPSRGWAAEALSPEDDEESTGGLVSVLVARKHRWDRASVCGYLVDVYCLGVKNAFGPDIKTDVELSQFLPEYYAAYPAGWQDAPIDLAADIVLGAVGYARSLGFEPHADFAQAAGQLGAWEGPPAITFGRGGKPFYQSGPYDNPRKVIETLERTVGPPPAFDYLVAGRA